MLIWYFTSPLPDISIHLIELNKQWLSPKCRCSGGRCGRLMVPIYNQVIPVSHMLPPLSLCLYSIFPHFQNPPLQSGQLPATTSTYHNSLGNPGVQFSQSVRSTPGLAGAASLASLASWYPFVQSIFLMKSEASNNSLALLIQQRQLFSHYCAIL